MQIAPVQIALLAYPGVSLAALEGLTEILTHADRLTRAEGGRGIDVVRLDAPSPQGFDAVVLPPAFGSGAFRQPDAKLVRWIAAQAQGGAVIASACAGAFYLAAAGVLDGRAATTHWALSEELAARFPEIRAQAERITLWDGPVLTAGGLFSWIDLGLELAARFASVSVMRALGRYFVVDTGRRDQRHFRGFLGPSDHGDAVVMRAQRLMGADPAQAWRIPALAAAVGVSDRALLRRFVAATGKTPLGYLQALRISVAQDLLSDGAQSVAEVALAAGYENANAFRRLFQRETGLTPSAYRHRQRR